MIDGHISAQKAEQIYDERKVLQSIKDYISKLESEQWWNEHQGLPRNEDLESRVSAARTRRDDKEAKIEQMEIDYQGWLRDNA